MFARQTAGFAIQLIASRNKAPIMPMSPASAGLMWHPVTGNLWETEHGPTGGEESNVTEPRHHHDRPAISNGPDRHARSEGTARDGMELPLTIGAPAPAPSVIGLFAGDRFPQ